MLRGCLAWLLVLFATPVLAREPVLFDWFEYRGKDAVFEQPVPEGHYRNPVLAGFHPDPSITRAGDRFYLVNSSFAFFPGIPVFESTDLVHWRQIGNVIDRPSQLDFDGLGMSRGVFAPAIEYHDGTFYVVNTAVDSGGNFIVTATDPAGPWSDPAWLPTVDGIDPSLFFDDDGKVYLLNNGPPEGEPRYEGHRAIWMQAFDIAKLQPVGPRRVLVDGGVDPSTNPIWIEGPHIYKRDGWYYLNCAEGGTGPQHSQVILRSREAWGPYTPYDGNPILTQRDLPADRAHPITNAGHADLVEAPDGSWWATFLASRNYGGVHYNTGRETFLLPVAWKDGWPTILEHGLEIPYVAPGPTFLSRTASQAPSTGNFTWRDEFDAPELGRAWMFVRVPKQAWADPASHPGRLAIEPLAEGLDTLRNPAFLARRQQHIAFEASTALQVPVEAGTDAGIAAFQNETHWYFLGVRRVAAPIGETGGESNAEGEGGHIELFLEKSSHEGRQVVATRTLPAVDALQLKIEGDGGDYAFGFDAGQGWQWFAQGQDGTLLSTDVAGGFIGATLGPHARFVPDK
ncbi:glycoside hydrolase family 43 protein [Luteimonas salinilitoris]|uniref:glycoside hydrolase family 43 protein n=1 Tax=Luteimonas salinilitoris TaxID=3237697 RepID=UPI00399D1C6F